MKKSSKIKIVLLCVLIAGVVAVMSLASAVWDEERAVHIEPGEIENSTLIIGAHLIHLSALTQPIYEIAQDSAGESGQDRMYYKSELADGTWFDITEATTLADITTAGSPVGEEVIAALFLTHHTKSDGVTYDLRTGEPVALHDIRDPYELESMEELFPLKMQFDMLLESELDTEERREKIFDITAIFVTEVENDATAERDTQLAALQRYYNVLEQNGGGAAEMEIVQGVMDAVDASRRVEVFTILDMALTNYASKLQGIGVPMPEQKGGDEDEEEEEYEEPSPDTNLQGAVNDSLSNITESKTKYEGRMLSEGTTVMTLVQYEHMLALIGAAEGDNHTECDRVVALLLHLKNIGAGVVASKTAELAMLDDELLPRATQRYIGGLNAGENAEYQAAAAANSAQVLLNNIAGTNTGNVNIFRNELEFFIDARTKRISNPEGTAYVKQRLTETTGYRSSVPDDAFSIGANESIDSHIDFLTRLLRELELAGGGNEIDKLMEQKAELQTEYMSALDKNDLAGAAAVAARIADIDDQLAELLDEQDAGLNALKDELAALKESGGSADRIAELEAEIAMQQAGLSDGSVGARVAELKKACLDAIKSGDTGTLDTNLAALAGMLDPNFLVVFPALQDVHDAMAAQRDINGNDAYNDLIDMVESAILDNKSGYDAAMRTSLDTTDLDGIANDYFSGGLSSLLDPGAARQDLAALTDDKRALVTVMALDMYRQQTGNDAAATLMRAKTQRQIDLDNPCFFERIDDTAMEYLPCTAIEAVTRLRYVWHKNQNQGTLADGLTYYVFTVYSQLVQRSRDGSSSDQMSTAAKFQRVVHIPEDYTLEQLGLEAGYVTGTGYGYIISDEIRALAEELFGRFLTASAM